MSLRSIALGERYLSCPDWPKRRTSAWQFFWEGAFTHFLPPAFPILHICQSFHSAPAALQPHRRSDPPLRISLPLVPIYFQSIAKMSDLCYNCHQSMLPQISGSSYEPRLTLLVHLPRVCQQALEECLNCGALGHTWNFCHLGAHRLQPDYKYFALCHNCQKWHLPLPCQEPLVKCGGCEQLGHRREYCALDPSPSELFTTSMSAFISHSLTSGNSQWIMHNAALANEIYNIKMGAVMDTLQLAANRANGEEVRRYLSNAYRGTLHPSGTHGLTSARLSASSQPPAPATANTESQSLPLPRPTIPPQYHDPDHTLAPIQLHNVNTPQPSSSESSAQSADTAPVTRAFGIQTNHAYDGIFSFRTYEENAADERQAGIQNDSSGDGSITPRSSPCDARANSMEPEHEFYEGAIY
ncbi:hypothetical protein D6C77_03221 [Aureobasidium pullulans]|nr:hypothetical protein D6C77_03221 [Aureobasidium pullulans]